MAGKTLSSAPESIRKCRPKFRSKMARDDGLFDEPAVFIDNRPLRFPKPALGPTGSSWGSGRTDMRKLASRTLHARSIKTGPVPVVAEGAAGDEEDGGPRRGLQQGSPESEAVERKRLLD